MLPYHLQFLVLKLHALWESAVCALQAHTPGGPDTYFPQGGKCTHNTNWGHGKGDSRSGKGRLGEGPKGQAITTLIGNGAPLCLMQSVIVIYSDRVFDS